jgi:hypothetical protein
MGDVFLTYDDTGRSYLRRLFYVNVVLYILMGIALIVYMVDITILILVLSLSAIASLIYAIYFALKNPPREYDSETSDTYS